MTDFNRRDTPPQASPADAAKALADIWSNVAAHATDIAHARRTIYLAYIAEGFTETQALELVKTI